MGSNSEGAIWTRGSLFVESEDPRNEKKCQASITGKGGGPKQRK